jgi:hypothetical protein
MGAGSSRRTVVVATVAGDVELTATPEILAGLNWPKIGIRPGTAVAPLARIAVGTDEPPADCVGVLHGPGAVMSTITGRGAFAVRYTPGEPWLAQWEAGPVVVRVGADVVLCAGNTRDPGRWLNRLLRDVIVHRSRADGFRPGHAAVVGSGRAGLALAGHSGVGKTDVALRIAALGQVRTVSVDRVLLGSRDGVLVAGTLAFGLNIHLRTLDDLGVDVAPLLRLHRPVHDKVYLPVSEAEVVLGPMLHETALTHLAFLESSKVPGVIVLPAAQALASVTSTADDPVFDLNWLGFDPGPATDLPVNIGATRRSYRPGQRDSTVVTDLAAVVAASSTDDRKEELG